jgi:hypothetical protein
VETDPALHDLLFRCNASLPFFSPVAQQLKQFAQAMGTHPCIEQLLQVTRRSVAGANVAAKNAQGKSVRQLADQCRSTAVIAALTPSAV